MKITKEEYEFFNSMLQKSEEALQEHGIQIQKRYYPIFIDNAEKLFKIEMMRILGPRFNYLKEYDKVIEWLNNNGGKGLVLSGNCGTGKSVIATKVIPALMNTMTPPRIATWMNAKEFARRGEIENRSFWIIDDIGTEGQVKDYGTEVDKFEELLDKIDLKGGMAIITTNLTPDDIMERYGERKFGRLKANFEIIGFNHESMR